MTKLTRADRFLEEMNRVVPWRELVAVVEPHWGGGQTGRKATDKKYYRHTTFPGGIKETDYAKLQAKFPDRALKAAVKGMLPKGPLGYAMLRKLKIYGGASHPHAAQQPKALEI